MDQAGDFEGRNGCPPQQQVAQLGHVLSLELPHRGLLREQVLEPREVQGVDLAYFGALYGKQPKLAEVRGVQVREAGFVQAHVLTVDQIAPIDLGSLGNPVRSEVQRYPVVQRVGPVRAE